MIQAHTSHCKGTPNRELGTTSPPGTLTLRRVLRYTGRGPATSEGPIACGDRRGRGSGSGGEWVLEVTTESNSIVMDERAVRRAIARMAREIVERNAGTENLVLVGIHRRGVDLADLIAEEIEKSEGREIPRGSLDITLYRDDFSAIGPRPVIGSTDIPGNIEGSNIVIVDDVCHTGRTTRAALDELADFGRPGRIYLCVLVDRGGRELPIQPDFVGRHIEVGESQDVAVLVPEEDGQLAVELRKVD